MRLEALEQRTLLSVSPTLLDANLSASRARDGQTITVGYEIDSQEAVTVVLDFSILGDDGVVARDATHAVSVEVEAGVHWYTREFTINLPPGALSGEYDVTWSLDTGAADDASMTGVDALSIDPPIEVRVPVLMYHNVASTALDFYTTTTDEFAAQMRALKAYGYTAVSVEDVLDYRAGVKTPPEKPVLITFDDGHESLLTIVLPILADPAIDYQATAFINTAGVRPEDVPGGYPTDPLSWSQIRELDASGRIDIQSHTVNHLNLTALDAEALAAELADSKAAIELELGGDARVTCLAYPYGTYDETVAMAMWEAGYASGFEVYDTVEYACADKFAMDRIQMDWDTSVDLNQSGWYAFFMSRIEDPDVRIPNLSVTGVQFLDPATGDPVDVTRVAPGQTVLVRVEVNNRAAPAGVTATLKLDSDADPANGIVYDSHAATPGEDDLAVCPWGESSFEWTWTVPSDAPPGAYSLNVSFHDPLYVLHFKDPGWQSAVFEVHSPAQTPSLVDANLSTSHARDGQTLTVGYQIQSGEAASVTLNCTIVGADGIAVRDAVHAVSIDVEAGTHWYTREFALRLPPTAVPGEYDVTWSVDTGATEDSSLTGVAALTIDAPIEVRVPVLMYHNVAATATDLWTTTTENFLAQIRALKAYGYTAVSVQDVLDYRAGIKTPPDKPVLITFDDGYESLATIVLPILADPTIDYQATVFVSTASVRPEGEPGGYPTDSLSWSQIRELEASGRIDVQSHTVNHLDLTTLDAQTLATELADSKATLEQELAGEQVTCIAYPFGECDATVKMAAWEAGYASAFQVYADAVEMTCADNFGLERVQIDRNTSLQLDQGGWYNFFMSRIEDLDVKIPNLAVTGIQFLDATTKKPLDITKVQPGQGVLIRVSVNNRAASAGVIATLKLDSDRDPTNGVLFDSHAATPSQDVSAACPWGTTKLEWTWRVPANASLGQYYMDVSFHDPQYVLGFKDTGWQSAFRVAKTPLNGPISMFWRATKLIWSYTRSLHDQSAALDAAIEDLRIPLTDAPAASSPSTVSKSPADQSSDQAAASLREAAGWEENDQTTQRRLSDPHDTVLGGTQEWLLFGRT
ncbi:MAG TPA: polysaccharide deacetylase family protein [Thermoguttaceae bacterium]|nr:polysaccharide deacetylase family protein [Thermoguttaceae bacterium]